MTLSVATKLDGISVNLSDILVSSPGSDTPHISIPTNIAIDEILPPEWECPITGLVRKTYIIADNLVVSFAGNLIAAGKFVN